MNWFLDLVAQYQTELIAAGAMVLAFLVGKVNSVRDAIASVYGVFEQIVKFFGGSITEADGNGGKVSFSRILGVYVTYQIVQMAWMPGREIQEEMMTLFWVTIGYAMISKVITTAGPLVQDLIKAYLLKVQKIGAPEVKQ